MHLIVFVHGMWGRAADFQYVSRKLESEHKYIDFCSINAGTATGIGAGANGVVYRCTSNEGYFTYDGVDVCGLRLADEIERVVAQLTAWGRAPSEISIVGFSMGAMMARYAVGVLERRAFFSKVRPRTLAVTCGPHVGVNVLGSSLAARLYNFIGQFSMARTSRQAFLRDSATSPLFLRMTQAGSPWTIGLERFGRRVLYANIANDRRCEFYTAAASAYNPFAGRPLREMRGPFVPGFQQVVLDGAAVPHFPPPPPPNAARQTTPDQPRSVLARALNIAVQTLKLTVVLPLWFGCFLVNAGFQYGSSTLRTLRVRLDPMERTVDAQFEKFHAAIEEDPQSISQDSASASSSASASAPATALPLTPVMHTIVDQFSKNCRFERFYLRILNTEMAHSAAIMKLERPGWDEGVYAVNHLVSILVS